jgi:hypothetical protein
MRVKSALRAGYCWKPASFCDAEPAVVCPQVCARLGGWTEGYWRSLHKCEVAACACDRCG